MTRVRLQVATVLKPKTGRNGAFHTVLEGTEAPHPVSRRRRTSGTTVPAVGPDHRRHKLRGPEAVFALLFPYALQIGLTTPLTRCSHRRLRALDLATHPARHRRLIRALADDRRAGADRLLSCRQATSPTRSSCVAGARRNAPVQAQPHAEVAQASTRARKSIASPADELCRRRTAGKICTHRRTTSR